MSSLVRAALLCCAILAAPIRARTCSTYTFLSNARYASCVDLPVLNSHLHWNYDWKTNTVGIAFRHSAAEWIFWAINPTRQTMARLQALVAYQNSATGAMYAYTSSRNTTDTTLPHGSLSFGVPSIDAMFENGWANGVNQVWQVGPMSGGRPSIHPLSGGNVCSVGTLSFISGMSIVSGYPKQKRKYVHGVLNAVNWGMLMPLGAMIARYIKSFKSANTTWFYLHVTCQTAANGIEVAGWATGMKLGNYYSSNYQTHSNIGITLFALGTLQVFALLPRPKKDHKYRSYWNVCHYGIGYSIIVLSIINVFKGLDILNPDRKWKKAYIGILIFLGVNAAILEAFTCYLVSKRRKSEEQQGKAPRHRIR